MSNSFFVSNFQFFCFFNFVIIFLFKKHFFAEILVNISPNQFKQSQRKKTFKTFKTAQHCDPIGHYVATLFVTSFQHVNENFSENQLSEYINDRDSMVSVLTEDMKNLKWSNLLKSGWPVFGMIVELFPKGGVMKRFSEKYLKKLSFFIDDDLIHDNYVVERCQTLLAEMDDFENKNSDIPRQIRLKVAACKSVFAARLAEQIGCSDDVLELVDEIQASVLHEGDGMCMYEKTESGEFVNGDAKLIFQALKLIEAVCNKKVDDGSCASNRIYKQEPGVSTPNFQNSCEQLLLKASLPTNIHWEQSISKSIFQPFFLNNNGKVAEKVTQIPPTLDSILPSEAFAFVSFALKHKVDTVIESGAGYGGSLSFWCLFEEFKNVFSVDWQFRNEVREVVNNCESKYNPEQQRQFHLLEDDGTIILPKLIEKIPKTNTIAIFIDGPKGCIAAKLASQLLNKNENVKVVGVHDVTLTSNTYRENSCNFHIARDEIHKNVEGGKVFFSDREWFVEGYGRRLDEGWLVRHENLHRGDRGGSDGPVIAVWGEDVE